MIQDIEKTNVQFYLATYDAEELDEQPTKEVLAVFVDTKRNGTFECYEQFDKHTICFESFLAEKCRKATTEEYQDLKTELESIGYNLNIL